MTDAKGRNVSEIHMDGSIKTNQILSQIVLQQWRHCHNNRRSHSSPDYLIPNEFTKQWRKHHHPYAPSLSLTYSAVTGRQEEEEAEPKLCLYNFGGFFGGPAPLHLIAISSCMRRFFSAIVCSCGVVR